jgi:hypothetical protein
VSQDRPLILPVEPMQERERDVGVQTSSATQACLEP